MRYCDNGCGYKLPEEYADNETTCGACLDELDSLRVCEQGCGSIATVYAGGLSANDWAGYYCENCIPLGFSVWNKYPNGIINNNNKKEGK